MPWVVTLQQFRCVLFLQVVSSSQVSALFVPGGVLLHPSSQDPLRNDTQIWIMGGREHMCTYMCTYEYDMYIHIHMYMYVCIFTYFCIYIYIYSFRKRGRPK